MLMVNASAGIQLAAFVGVHGIAVAAAVAGLAGLVGLRGHLGVVVMAGGVVAFLPVLGVACLIVGAVLWHRVARQPEVRGWERTPIPALPSQPIQVSDRPLYSRGGVIEALRHATDPEPRVHAVMAATQLPDRHAIPVLRMALRDVADDVRLFAYSALDRKESTINASIHALQRRLRAGEDRPAIHARLAQKLWDLAYLGLAQGAVRRHVLGEAEHHAQRALAGRAKPGLNFLLARIALARESLDEAGRYLDAAAAGGIDESELAPYRAEVAYYQRDYAGVRNALAGLPPIQRGDSALTEVVDYWLAE